MKIRERIRIRQEARSLYRAYLSEGLDGEAAADKTLVTMEEKYGASIDWAKIFELILLLLSLFMQEGES